MIVPRTQHRVPLRFRLTILAIVAVVAIAIAYLPWGPPGGNEAVWFQNGDVTLAGRLYLPRGAGPFPTVVAVPGPGRVRARDMSEVARRLVPRGIAVLLYDRRGIGRSAGVYRRVTVANAAAVLDTLAGDAFAAVHAIVRRPEVDSTRIGLFGRGEAGWVMPLAAARGRRVAFMVVVAGPAVSVGQQREYRRLTGEDEGARSDPPDDLIARRFAAFDGPYGFDPSPAIESLDAPSFWIFGGRDRTTPTDASVTILDAIARLRPGMITVRVFPSGTHTLRDARTRRRLAIWDAIDDWLAARGVSAPR